ncbi:MAG: hypothetical protein GX241_05200 [Ruminococcaceae bacterium]|nr:hypothetical protein [Oscillospiraceae bacterium]
MVLTEYTIETDKVTHDYTFIMLSDLHNKSFKKILDIVDANNPNAIFVVGDIVDRHMRTSGRARPFLKACLKIAPTFFSLGNHEVQYPVISKEQFEKTGVIVLDDSFVCFEDFAIGGQTSKSQNLTWLYDFTHQDKFLILLDHHPENYKSYLKDHFKCIDLILSGHTHGGQIKICGQGLFSPGQGLFPKYTHGFYDGKLIVNAGLVNTGGLIPRIKNPPEIVKINIKKKKEEYKKQGNTKNKEKRKNVKSIKNVKK